MVQFFLSEIKKGVRLTATTLIQNQQTEHGKQGSYIPNPTLQHPNSNKINQPYTAQFRSKRKIRVTITPKLSKRT